MDFVVVMAFHLGEDLHRAKSLTELKNAIKMFHGKLVRELRREISVLPTLQILIKIKNIVRPTTKQDRKKFVALVAHQGLL